MMAVDRSIYRSPKRKRECASLGPLLTNSNLSRRYSSPSNDAAEDVGSRSPSTRITGKLQKLDLQCPIKFATSCAPYSSDEDEASASSHVVAPTPSPPPRSASPRIGASSSKSQEFKPPELAEFKFEPSFDTGAEKASRSDDRGTPTRLRSPSPSSVISDQYWHASEITGWSPGDPDEDNYGINGVGYAKTASKAWAISQKRKQQIADYRSRETREARRRRHERRLSGFNSRRGSPRGSPAPRMGEHSVENNPDTLEKKEVRFAVCNDD